MRECDSCKFCCWSFNVDVPNPRYLTVLEPKRERRHCEHECEAGCRLHGHENQPDICRGFRCAYIEGQDIHRPDNFQVQIEAINGSMGNFIPAVSIKVPISEAQSLIAQSRTIPAHILLGGNWTETVLPLDKNEYGGWATSNESVALWGELYARHGEILSLQREDAKQLVYD